MKKMLVVLVLMVVATVGQSVFAQSIERQVKNASVAVDAAGRKFNNEKEKKVAELKKEAKHQTTIGLRANTSEGRDAAVATLKKLNAEIDSISKISTNADIQAKTKLLAELQQQQTLPAKPSISAKDETVKVEPAPAIAEEKKVDPYDRAVPTRLTKVNRNQRARSHDVRVDEMVISQIENNINSNISPSGQNGGYKVIFDNMYSQPVNFIARSTSSSVKVAVMVDPGVMRTKYMLPGKYMVEIYINGVMSGQPRPMTIDGQECDYKGNLCFNYAFAPKFR